MRHRNIDPDVWVTNASEPKFGFQLGKVSLRTHAAEKCAGRHCVIHDPSDHHMKDWPTNFRADKYMTERTCPHGVGHPDPDDMVYHRQQGNDWKGLHGCDGCCVGENAKDETV